MRTRGASGARWETRVCARSAVDRWADRALLRESTRPFGRFHPFGCSAAASWVCALFPDRDLTRFVIPDGGVFQSLLGRFGSGKAAELSAPRPARERREPQMLRGAFGARLETFVGAGSAGAAGPIARCCEVAGACAVSLCRVCSLFPDRGQGVPTSERGGGCAEKILDLLATPC